jgi:ribosomal protein S18 acetylase RimI-like enzyme
VADVEVSPARDEDLEPVYELVAENRRQMFGDVSGFELTHMQNLWPLLRGNWVAYSGADLMGAAALVFDGVEVDVRLDVRRRGIGTRLLRVAEEATDRESLRADAVTLEPAAAPFLHANGYEKGWEYWLMRIDLLGAVEEPVWPDGVLVRTFREDAQQLWSLLELAYADDLSTELPQFSEWRELMLGDPSFEPENVFLVEVDGELVAAALNWKEGFVKDLVVHPAWRRRGLGTALMLHAFRHFRARGISLVELKTDSVNPTDAWRLYEKLGMRKERTYEVFLKRLA